MLRRSLVLIVIVLTLLAPAAASAMEVSASSEGFEATLTYRGSTPHFSELRLQIVSDDGTMYDAPVVAPVCGHACWPVKEGRNPVLGFANVFNDEGGPYVVLNLYSGGAHCCSITQVFGGNPNQNKDNYVLAATHNFGNSGYELERLSGKVVFVTADNRFAYAFTDFAASGLPLQILQLAESGRFMDVTARYPELVRRDAAHWLAAYRKAHGEDDVGLIAPWVADECTLGRSGTAFAYLEAQARAGRLNTSFGAAESGRRFVGELRALLARAGYLR
jgi:hypothetical protein